MKLGYFLPQMGRVANADNIVKVAREAETQGFDSVWVTDRLLYPVKPKTPYAASPDGMLPEAYKIVYEPLEALTWAAAHTTKIGIGTSVLDMPFYNAILLAKRTATIDALSGGRLRLGLGQGWSQDEYEATDADASKRGKRSTEFIEVLHEVWKNDPAEFDGKYFHLSKSHINPKPVQKPHPPIYLAAFAPAAMKRIAHHADGWMPVAIPVPGMEQMWGAIKGMAKEAGRNPDELKLIVRGNMTVTDEPLGDDRWIFTGTWDQIKSDAQAVKGLGADELILDPTFSRYGETVEGFLEAMGKVRGLAG
ncbi:MAG: LLM class F420-dependent oxidoreductase [Dehalococcoidia bacterium]